MKYMIRIENLDGDVVDGVEVDIPDEAISLSVMSVVLTPLNTKALHTELCELKIREGEQS